MADERRKGSYTYPNTSDDPDRTNVLKNRWGIETHSELRVKEYSATGVRMQEIAEGDGPKGNFDKAHLKAIHGYIFRMCTNGPVIRATKVPSLRVNA